MLGILSTGIIILKNYIIDPLVGIARIGRYDKLIKRVNKVSLK